MAGGSGTQTSTHLILTGGVNYSIFKKALDGKAGKDYLTHDPSWYRFNDDLLCFDFTHKNGPSIPTSRVWHGPGAFSCYIIIVYTWYAEK